MINYYILAFVAGIGSTFVLFLFMTRIPKPELKVYKAFIEKYWLLGLKILAISACILLMPYIFKTFEYFSLGDHDNPAGDTFAGITAPFVGIGVGILTFAAFWIQYQANEQLKADLRVERFETKFYEMLRIHRENVAELKIGDKVSGRKSFVSLYYEFKLIYTIIDRHNEKIIETKDLLNLVYSVYFYGFSEDNNLLYSSKLSKEERKLLQLAKNDLLDIQEGYKTHKICEPYKYPNFTLNYYPFDGHVNKLGHYYRHLIETLRFIHKQEIFESSEQKKREYVKLLRTQISNFEQLMLYFNMVSWFKEEWEEFVIQYHFLKNLPIGFTMFAKYNTPMDFFREEILKSSQEGNCMFELHQGIHLENYNYEG